MEVTKKLLLCKHPREIEQMLVKALAALLFFATQRKTFLTRNTHIKKYTH